MQLLCARDHESLPFDSWPHLSPVATWRRECRSGISQSPLPLPICHQDPQLCLPSQRGEASLGKHMQASLLAVRAALRALLTLRQCGAAVVSLEGTFCISHICRNTKCCWMQTIQGLIG